MGALLHPGTVVALLETPWRDYVPTVAGCKKTRLDDACLILALYLALFRPVDIVRMSAAGEGVVIMILAAAGMGISLFFWLGLSKYRTSRTVRLGQPAFCMAFVVGFYLSIFQLQYTCTSLSCLMRCLIPRELETRNARHAELKPIITGAL